MPVVNRSSLVMHSAEQMFQLINDIAAYPEFVPDCHDSKVLESSDSQMTASLLVAKGGIKKWFTTKNTLVSNESVEMSLVDGPFKKLTGKWHLTKLSDEACKINLELQYEFSSKVFDLAFGKAFNHMANNMVQAFIARAKDKFGGANG
ncbi:type II toxin-antitoxin system RatA family toxin [Thalassotalea agarivorans]|uniref:Ribosome association toxin PasT (RatA) of the RatAB toxin-antitoxin module n=1 Tax=Thalassotalea agarivorans TaxID=349064 RepID=A0A1H9ZLF9_THASX|nr:type II toxin-antitoxin system RatA family toxin [Thalassotalea agarivorans]SES82388.1 Ribosome association toxin PasT (RatA) of the RatAB toxin-antitoxin module [Thalassotalea agarivorans]